MHTSATSLLPFISPGNPRSKAAGVHARLACAADIRDNRRRMPKQPKPFTARQEKFGSVFVKVMSQLNTWLYRVSGGRVTGRMPGGQPVLLLITIGRKSGQPQTAPLLYLKDGDGYVVVASKGGMSHDPLWFKNLQANPRVEVEVGNAKLPMTARRASADEKAALWPKLLTMYPSYADYQARTTRDIPVVLLTPRR
jgi:F420H(2)-dependent quinone reductase